jgi:deferrochelatase/peroxidase EfeB
VSAPAPAPWPLDKIQGLLLRGYRSNYARHFALSVAPGAAAAARSFILGLVAPEPEGLAVTTAAPWTVKPPYRLNLAFTYRGLVNLGVPAASLGIFTGPPGQVDSNYAPFGGGASQRAALYLNDPNSSEWLFSDSDFDLLLTIWIDDFEWRDKITDIVKALTPGTFDALPDDRILDAQAFEGNKVYFGYEDNISQPIIQGSPVNRYPDDQDEVDSSGFLIGTGTNIYDAIPFSPPQLGLYGCFGGFLKLHQHVELFEQQVKDRAGDLSAIGVTVPEVQQEALMAAMCGRWRNGVSLTAHPIQGDVLPPPFDKPVANDYHYGTAAKPDQGAVCPIGAHMRRGNMRLRADDPPLKPTEFPAPPSSDHRIMRRAMPYQSPYNCEDRDDPATERGLMGVFLGASLLQQFEQVFGQWMNGMFFTEYRELTDAMLGATDPHQVSLPGRRKWTKGGVKSVVDTKIAAYVFYPGVDGIRFIAGA